MDDSGAVDDIGAVERLTAERVAGIQRILADLVPELGARVRFSDLTGHVYDRPSALAARVQLQLAAMLGDADLEQLRDLVRTEGSVLSSVARAAQALVERPELLALIDRAFRLVHPGVVEAAAARCTAAGWVVPDEPGCLDVFDLEAAFRALLPFAVRPVTQILGLLETGSPSA